MNTAISSMLERYRCETRSDYENALKEIFQEVALLGLWRAKFFEHAAFYRGTALRILYGLDRFSEDLYFSLLVPNRDFKMQPYLVAIEAELKGMDFTVEVSEKSKSMNTSISHTDFPAHWQQRSPENQIRSRYQPTRRLRDRDKSTASANRLFGK